MLVTATKVFSLTTILVVAIGVVTMAPLTALGAITEEGEGLKPIFGRELLKLKEKQNEQEADDDDDDQDAEKAARMINSSN